MSKRLQVLFDEAELSEIQETARRQKMTTAEWVRQAVRIARREAPGGDAQKRLEVIRAAARHDFPTADIDEMLAEIERGYRSGSAA
jgi:hypothetical protein